MQPGYMTNLQQWFQAYAASYYSQDEDIHKHIILKEEHTFKVVENARELAIYLGLSSQQQQLAAVIALFHDLGRFKQYADYRTFVDHQSIDHALLGISILNQTEVLNCLLPKERHLVLLAISHHNSMKLPEELSPEEKLFATILRDADKLDIYRVLGDNIPAPSSAGYSSFIIDDLLAGRQSSYRNMKTADDRKLMRLSWVYDINYRWTLEQVVKRGCLEPIIAQLPPSREVEDVVCRLKTYIALGLSEKGKLTHFGERIL